MAIAQKLDLIKQNQCDFWIQCIGFVLNQLTKRRQQNCCWPVLSKRISTPKRSLGAVPAVTDRGWTILIHHQYPPHDITWSHRIRSPSKRSERMTGGRWEGEAAAAGTDWPAAGGGDCHCRPEMPGWRRRRPVVGLCEPAAAADVGTAGSWPAATYRHKRMVNEWATFEGTTQLCILCCLTHYLLGGGGGGR